MTWEQYLRMLVLLIAAACVASPVLKTLGTLVVVVVLYILGRLWLVGLNDNMPPALRRQKRK